jgi:hypothetical protein
LTRSSMSYVIRTADCTTASKKHLFSRRCLGLTVTRKLFRLQLRCRNLRGEKKDGKLPQSCSCVRMAAAVEWRLNGRSAVTNDSQGTEPQVGMSFKNMASSWIAFMVRRISYVLYLRPGVPIRASSTMVLVVQRDDCSTLCSTP